MTKEKIGKREILEEKFKRLENCFYKKDFVKEKLIDSLTNDQLELFINRMIEAYGLYKTFEIYNKKNDKGD